MMPKGPSARSLAAVAESCGTMAAKPHHRPLHRNLDRGDREYLREKQEKACFCGIISVFQSAI
jgi:hypothetical protein